MKKLALILLALLLVPAAADAKRKPKPKYQRAQFDVSVLIMQGTDWTTISDDEALECRTKTIGSGNENVYFKTAAPQRINVFATRNLGTYVFGNLFIDGIATVEREGHLTTTVEDPCPPVAEGDGDDVGGEPPPAPDCGTKTGPFGFDLSFTRKTVELVSDSSRGNYDLFANCPVNGTYYPDLLTVGDDAPGFATIRAPLSLRDLLNPKKKSFVIEHGGELHDNLVDTQTVSRIGWKITLERVVRGTKR